MARNPGPEPVTLVCAADDPYAMPLAVALRSAQDALAAGRALRAWVLDGGLRERSRERLRRSLDPARVELRFVAPDARIFERARVAPGRISTATYFRLIAPLLLPEEARRAIYLDADLVVRSDLGRLFEADLGAHPAAAVQDALAPTLGSPRGLAIWSELGLAPDLPYFNAGVLVLDLERWRRESLAERLVDFVRERGAALRWWDQDALNALLAGRIQRLDPRWNHFASEPADAEPWVVHYAAAAKPWHWGFPHPPGEAFFRTLDRTDWAGWRPRKRLRDTAAGRIGARVRASLRHRLSRLRGAAAVGAAGRARR